jgi:hypothetical protein
VFYSRVVQYSVISCVHPRKAFLNNMVLPHNASRQCVEFSAAACVGNEVGGFELCEIHPRLSVHLLCIWPFYISYD